MGNTFSPPSPQPSNNRRQTNRSDTDPDHGLNPHAHGFDLQLCSFRWFNIAQLLFYQLVQCQFTFFTEVNAVRAHDVVDAGVALEPQAVFGWLVVAEGLQGF